MAFRILGSSQLQNSADLEGFWAYLCVNWLVSAVNLSATPFRHDVEVTVLVKRTQLKYSTRSVLLCESTERDISY